MRCPQFQVLKAVVRLVAVQVMDALVAEQRTPDVGLHDNPMHWPPLAGFGLHQQITVVAEPCGAYGPAFFPLVNEPWRIHRLSAFQKPVMVSTVAANARFVFAAVMLANRW